MNTPAKVTTEGEGFWSKAADVAIGTGAIMGTAAVTAFAAGVGYVAAYGIGKLCGIFPKNA